MGKSGTVLEVSFNVLVTDEDIDDIMVSVLEGGINHWCAEALVQGEYLGEFASDQISRGGTLLLYDVKERKYEELTKEKFLAGLKRYLEDPIYDDTVYPGAHEDRYLLDCTLIDAPASDMIIQYALFGEIVYG
jgi:hypothetical protein